MFSPRLLLFKFIDCWKKRLSRCLVEDPLTPAQVFCLVAITVLLMISIPVMASAFGGWALVVGDRVVAVSPNREALEAAINERFHFGEAGNEGAPRVTLRRAAPGEGPLVLNNQLEDVLARALGAEARGTAVAVNGEIKLVVSDRQVAGDLLAELKNQYSIPGGEVKLAEEVTLRDVRVPSSRILKLEEALSVVQRGGRKRDLYRVRPGDTLWDIAAKAGFSVEELQAANPGLTPEKLQIGQEIDLVRAAPLINVVATGVRTERREIPFTVEKRRDNSMYRGQYRVLQPGRPGLEEVTYRITYKNGREVDREMLANRVLRESQNQVVSVGSRVLLASRSEMGGRLAWPTVGAVVSPFGQRWGRLHSGIDIAAGTGSPVRAAEYGRVIQAGWAGNYGYSVDVYHGDGVVTRYAHLSSVAVQVGQQVSRGQLLGRVGSTGNATGPHLHFEVLVNGRPVNPARFL